jgi:hypothetical protein
MIRQDAYDLQGVERVVVVYDDEVPSVDEERKDWMVMELVS